MSEQVGALLWSFAVIHIPVDTLTPQLVTQFCVAHPLALGGGGVQSGFPFIEYDTMMAFCILCSTFRGILQCEENNWEELRGNRDGVSEISVENPWKCRVTMIVR